MVFPNLPFDEYRACASQLWETGELIYVALSLAYGTLSPSSTAHTPASDFVLVQDALALLIVIYSAKRGCRIRVDSVPRLLDKILQDATTYFLVLSTGNLLLLFFELFGPVSEAVDFHSTTHDKLYTGFN